MPISLRKCNPIQGLDEIEASLVECPVAIERESRPVRALAGPNDLIQLAADPESWRALWDGFLWVGKVWLEYKLITKFPQIESELSKLSQKGRDFLAALDARGNSKEETVSLTLDFRPAFDHGDGEQLDRGAGFMVRGLPEEDKLLRINLMARYGDQIIASLKALDATGGYMAVGPDHSVELNVDEANGQVYVKTSKPPHRQYLI